VRQRLAEHRTIRCAPARHNLMDPVGLSLEKFDAIGRWRASEGGDAQSTRPEAFRRHPVRRCARARKALLKHPDVFAGTLAEKSS